MIFSQNDQDDLLRSSNKANSIMNEWEELLSLRIALQKPLDLANKLPAYDFNEVIKVVDKSEQVELKECQRALVKSLETTAVSLLDSLNPTQSQSKRKFSDTDELWEDMMSVQTSLQVNWEKTMDKWATRMHYGSEKARAQLKVFNQSAWGQIESVVSEERRIMEKGRMPADESERIGVKSELDVVNQILRKEQGLDETDIEVADDEDMDGIHGFVEGLYIHPKGLGDDDRKAKKRKVYDAEVYDDRQLYSLLLKTFISSHNGGTVGGMRADDLAALWAYKRKKSNVDRKASKGRKIRYTVHAKLQNFMFPIPTISEMQIDKDRLFGSLFQ